MDGIVWTNITPIGVNYIYHRNKEEKSKRPNE